MSPATSLDHHSRASPDGWRSVSHRERARSRDTCRVLGAHQLMSAAVIRILETREVGEMERSPAHATRVVATNVVEPRVMLNVLTAVKRR